MSTAAQPGWVRRLMRMVLRHRTDVVLAFGGIGSAAKDWGELSNARVAGGGGVGFRYLLAKKFGIRSGVDVAVGTGGKPLFYLQNGAAWK